MTQYCHSAVRNINHWKQCSLSTDNVRKQSLHQKHVKIRSALLQGKCEKQCHLQTQVYSAM